MAALEQALAKLAQVDTSTSSQGYIAGIDARARLIVTLLYIVAVLTLPLASPDRLLLFALYPMAASVIAGVEYGRVLAWSLAVVPFAAMIAMFNPMMNREVTFYVGSLPITYGWASFFTIVLRAVLATQALLVLIFSTGFQETCHSLQRLGVPSLFSSLILFIYRYIRVLLQEAVSMDRARRSRGFGRRHYPLQMWGTFVGQLLLRSLDRAERIQRAMDARGFDGRITSLRKSRWTWRSTVYLVAWSLYFGIIWLLPPHLLFAFLP